MSNTYNGWTNWQTWNFMLHEREGLNVMMEDLVEMEDVKYRDVHTAVLGYIDNMIEEMDIPSGFVRDVVEIGFSDIDVYEISQELMDVFEIVEIVDED